MAAIVIARPGCQKRLVTPLEATVTGNISRMLLIVHYPESNLIFKYMVAICYCPPDSKRLRLEMNSVIEACKPDPPQDPEANLELLLRCTPWWRMGGAGIQLLLRCTPWWRMGGAGIQLLLRCTPLWRMGGAGYSCYCGASHDGVWVAQVRTISHSAILTLRYGHTEGQVAISVTSAENRTRIPQSPHSTDESPHPQQPHRT